MSSDKPKSEPTDISGAAAGTSPDVSAETTPAAKPVRTSGLGPKEQKLQAMRAKLEAQKNGGGKQNFGHNGFGGGKGASAGHKKTSFQRKAT